MRVGRVHVVTAFVACLLATATVAPAVAAPAVAAQQPPVLQTAVDPDAVVMTAAVDAEGSAKWTVEYRVRLADANETAAFESVQADVADNASAFTSRFSAGMGRTVASAENATDRGMALRNVTVAATQQRLGQDYGVLTYRFRWTGFAAVGDDRVRVGDALAGLFLDEETTLVVAAPDGYAVAEHRPPPTETRNASLVWRGPVDFGPDEPRVVYAPATPGGSTGPLPLGVTAVAVSTAVAALAVLVAGWVAVGRRREGGDETGPGSGLGTVTEPDVASGAGATGPAAETARNGTAGDDGGGVDPGTGDGAPATGDEADGTVATGDDPGDQSATDAESDDSAPAADPAEELLSNEERVLRLLDREGGRVKQQRIAGELDWTDAKTSQVVGSLRDDDAVETFRLGRENVVTLPEESDL